MEIVKQSLLHYQKGTSNKVYNVYLIKNSDGFLVNFEYGRFGANLRDGTKTKKPETLEKATKIYDSLVKSKIKSGYKLKEGFDPKKQQLKKERDSLKKYEYEKWLREKFEKVKAEKNSRVDNYRLSRLIYRAGEANLKSLKDIIAEIYKIESLHSQDFLYSLAFFLGRVGDKSDLEILEKIEDALNQESKYIAKDAIYKISNYKKPLFVLDNIKKTFEDNKLEELAPGLFEQLFKNNIDEKEIILELISTKLTLLQDFRSNWEYQILMDTDSWWFENMSSSSRKNILERKKFYKEQKEDLEDTILMLYFNRNLRDELKKILEGFRNDDISLFKKVYRLANFRKDFEVLAKISTIAYAQRGIFRGFGFYLKRRDLRHLKMLARFYPEDYINYAKEILLSLNGFEDDFKESQRSWISWEDWSTKKLFFDELSYHVTAFFIIDGNSPYHSLMKNKKAFLRVTKRKNNSFKTPYKELWENNFKTLLEILSKSDLEIVQKFAFDILRSKMDTLRSLEVSSLLPLLKLKNREAREFFFEILKDIYAQNNNQDILKAFLLSSDSKILKYGIELARKNIDIFAQRWFLVHLIFSAKSEEFDEILELAKDVISSEIVDDIIETLLEQKLPLDKSLKSKFLRLLKTAKNHINLSHIQKLFSSNSLNDFTLISAELIREINIDMPLSIKEHISRLQHPQMLATLIFLLGKLDDEVLSKDAKLLIHFLFDQEKLIRKESQQLIKGLSKKYPQILLGEFIQYAFKSVDDEVKKDALIALSYLKSAYKTLPSNTIFRLVTAKSKMADDVASKLINSFVPEDFSVAQWVIFAKNRNKIIREWAFDAFSKNQKKIKDAMPKPLEIFDCNWKDTISFAKNYFSKFELSLDEIVIIADNNSFEVQEFAQELIKNRGLSGANLANKLSQHPSQLIQRFVVESILKDLSSGELLKLEEFFNRVLLSVNSNRVVKSQIIEALNQNLRSKEVAKMYADLAKRHYNTLVKTDRESFVLAMFKIKQNFPEISLPIKIIEEVELKDAI